MTFLKHGMSKLAPIRIYLITREVNPTLTCFMKTIHIELSNEGGKVAMFEIQRKDFTGKIIHLFYQMLFII